MIKSDSLVKLTTALVQAKQEFGPVLREAENPGFKRDGKPSKYADLATVIEATEPSLAKNGLVISQFPHNEGNQVGVFTILLHTSGEYLGHEFTLSLARQDAQTGVAAVSYARRTGWKAVLGLREEDDDGNAASAAPAAEKATARPNNPPKTAPAGPPKAEIPNETTQSSGSNTSTASASDHSLPSAEELNTYRVRFGKLVDALSTAGLKSSKGLPLQKKVLAYLLQEGKKEAAEKISKADWELFFSNVGAVSNGEGGISKLVELVNSAVGGTN